MKITTRGLLPHYEQERSISVPLILAGLLHALPSQFGSPGYRMSGRGRCLSCLRRRSLSSVLGIRSGIWSAISTVGEECRGEFDVLLEPGEYLRSLRWDLGILMMFLGN